jgi:integrase
MAPACHVAALRAPHWRTLVSRSSSVREMYPFSHALHGDVFMSPDRGERSRWKGWQAYRRGLATNLKRLGVPDTVIQAILRHEDVSTTQRFYIKTVREDVTSAMKQLEAQDRMYSSCTAKTAQQFGKLNKVNQKPT